MDVTSLGAQMISVLSLLYKAPSKEEKYGFLSLTVIRSFGHEEKTIYSPRVETVSEMKTLSRFGQFLKASLPIIFTLFGI